MSPHQNKRMKKFKDSLSQFEMADGITNQYIGSMFMISNLRTI